MSRGVGVMVMSNVVDFGSSEESEVYLGSFFPVSLVFMTTKDPDPMKDYEKNRMKGFRKSV